MKQLALTGLLLLGACGGDGLVPVVRRDEASPTRDEKMFRQNREAVILEDRDIDLLVERHAWPAEATPTGVRYVIRRDVPGETIRPEQWATVNYRVELVNGDTAYATEPGHPESFRVEHDDVESGLHEAIQLLSPGDSATFIIPSYRAHGLIGDLDRIPPRSTVVYHIGLVSIQER